MCRGERSLPRHTITGPLCDRTYGLLLTRERYKRYVVCQETNACYALCPVPIYIYIYVYSACAHANAHARVLNGTVVPFLPFFLPIVNRPFSNSRFPGLRYSRVVTISPTFDEEFGRDIS